MDVATHTYGCICGGDASMEVMQVGYIGACPECLHDYAVACHGVRYPNSLKAWVSIQSLVTVSVVNHNFKLRTCSFAGDWCESKCLIVSVRCRLFCCDPLRFILCFCWIPSNQDPGQGFKLQFPSFLVSNQDPGQRFKLQFLSFKIQT